MNKIALALIFLTASISFVRPYDIDCTDPTTNGKIIEDSMGYFYKIYCGSDLENHDLVNYGDMTLDECIDLCSTTDDCVSLTYHDAIDHCYLKHGVGEVIPDQALTSAIIVSSIYVPPFTTNCSDPSTNGSIVTDNYGVSYQLFCKTNLQGSDLSGFPGLTMAQCITKCSTIENCKGVTYTGHCYLKGGNKTQSSTNAASAVRIETCSEFYDTVNKVCVPECPSLLVQADTTIGTKICKNPCPYYELFYDVPNHDCVIGCTQSQIASMTSGINTCTSKRSGCKKVKSVAKRL